MTVTPDQKKRLLKAKIAVALQDELGRVPKEEEIDQVFLLTRVMYKAVLGLHFKCRQQKQQGAAGHLLSRTPIILCSLARPGSPPTNKTSISNGTPSRKPAAPRPSPTRSAAARQNAQA